MKIQQIIAMLQLDNHYGVSESVDIAKGKYKLHTSLKKAYKQLKRNNNGRG
jgi:hypothetical protein